MSLLDVVYDAIWIMSGVRTTRVVGRAGECAFITKMVGYGGYRVARRQIPHLLEDDCTESWTGIPPTVSSFSHCEFT